MLKFAFDRLPLLIFIQVGTYPACRLVSGGDSGDHVWPLDEVSAEEEPGEAALVVLVYLDPSISELQALFDTIGSVRHRTPPLYRAG